MQFYSVTWVCDLRDNVHIHLATLIGQIVGTRVKSSCPLNIKFFFFPLFKKALKSTLCQSETIFIIKYSLFIFVYYVFCYLNFDSYNTSVWSFLFFVSTSSQLPGVINYDQFTSCITLLFCLFSKLLFFFFEIIL